MPSFLFALLACLLTLLYLNESIDPVYQKRTLVLYTTNAMLLQEKKQNPSNRSNQGTVFVVD